MVQDGRITAMFVVAGIAAVAVFGAGLWSSLRETEPEPSAVEQLEDLAHDPELDAIRDRAQDRIAQSNLRNALVTAKVYFVDEGSYDGFGPEAAANIEPSLAWAGDRPAAAGVVSINLAEGEDIVLTMASDSGQAFCIGEARARVRYGTRDAHGVESAKRCGSTQAWTGP